MPSINVNSTKYPPTNYPSSVSINNIEMENIYINLQDPILSIDNNISLDTNLQYTDYSVPGSTWIPNSYSLSLNDDNIYGLNLFSNIINLCNLQKNILDQLYYTIDVYDSTLTYQINTLVSYISANYTGTYTYMSLNDDNTDNQPDLFYNYWQLQEWSSLEEYSFGNPVFYNYVYSNIATPNRKGIYTCLLSTPGITNTPYNNTSQWQLQSWLNYITYSTNYIVQYSELYYISTKEDNLGNTPTSSSDYWSVITL
jgi:hypothetical protein